MFNVNETFREGRHTSSFETVRLSTGALALRVGGAFGRTRRAKGFRSNHLNLTIWLPLAAQAGGAPAIWPNSPPIPLPDAEHLGGAHPKASSLAGVHNAFWPGEDGLQWGTTPRSLKIGTREDDILNCVLTSESIGGAEERT
jgi:hypothetical protein